MRVSGLAPSISFDMLKTSMAASLSNPSSFASFATACDICPTGILSGARCLFASGSSICFVVILATGAAVNNAAADDDAGVAAGLGVCSPIFMDLGLPRCA